MADNLEIALGLEVNGVQQSIASVKDLKKAIKDAKDEQIKAAETFGAGSAEYQKASKSVANLKDKMEDLSDSTQSLKGSGVESLNSSFGLLSQGFQDFDTDKIKAGFKGIGSAMSAIPILLIIEGVKLLIENFDKVVEFAKEVTGSFSSTEKQVRSLTKETEKQTIANKNLTAQYNAEIALLVAKGATDKEILEAKKKKIQVDILEAENTLRLNSAKVAEALLNDSITDSLDRITISLLRKIGNEAAAANLEKKILLEKKERIKDELAAVQDAGIKIKEAKTSLEVLDLEYNKKQIENAKKTTAENKKELDLRRKDWLDYYNNRDVDQAEYEAKSRNFSLDLKKQQDKENLETTKIGFDELTELEIQEQAKKFKALEEQRAKEKKDHEAFEKDKVKISTDIAIAGLNSVQQLTDIYFLFKKQKLEKGSKEEEELAKKAFNINKALQLATATITGIQSVQGAFATASASPITTVFPGYPFLQASIAGIASAANIAKIAATNFGSAGASLTNSSSGSSTVPIPQAPTLDNQSVNTNQNTTFDNSGKNNNVITVNANIGVDEITNKQTRVNVLETQRTF